MIVSGPYLGVILSEVDTLHPPAAAGEGRPRKQTTYPQRCVLPSPEFSLNARIPTLPSFAWEGERNRCYEATAR